MSHHNHPAVNISDIKPFKFSTPVKTILAVLALVGIGTFLLALKAAPDRVWPNFLVNYFFFLLLSLFGGFFTSIQHITNAYWSVTARRVAESLMAYLPVAFVLGFLLFLGAHHLYEWTHHEVVAKDPLLSGKSGYLNITFFAIRYLIFFGGWIALGFKMRKNSLEQDKSGDQKFTLSNVKLAAAFLPFFAISLTLFSFDLIMSLEPHWFSTIYGIYCFSGLFFSGLSLLAFLLITASKQGAIPKALFNENHLHDIAKFMFGFTVFWAYIMFSQLMLQWYANLPEEIPYYLRRFHGGWWTYGGILLVAHFVIPFFGLLPREAKRCASFVSKMALFMLVAQWMDVYFLVMPVFFKEGPVFGWVELGMFLGFLGIFGTVVCRALEKVPSVPLKDPRLDQCLGHNQ